MANEAYPLRVVMNRDENLSRWLWIIKGIMVIPHYIVMFFLAIPLILVIPIAWISVVVTGVYPKALWDYVVGVQRWSFRLSSYSSTLITDKYPPFTLQDDPEYPARYLPRYPEKGELSRLTVFFRLILAIPVLFLVGLLTINPNTWGYMQSPRQEFGFLANIISIMGLLSLAAGLSILITGKYSDGIFKWLSAFQRFSARVSAYVLFLVEPYPPIRLDAGEDEPGQPAEPATPSIQ